MEKLGNESQVSSVLHRPSLFMRKDGKREDGGNPCAAVPKTEERGGDPLSGMYEGDASKGGRERERAEKRYHVIASNYLQLFCSLAYKVIIGSLRAS